MILDAATLMFVVAIASSLAGGQLLWVWQNNREVLALLAWSVSFFLGGAAGFAALLGQGLEQFVWISLANLLAMSAFAVTFAGARLLAGKKPRFDLALAGPLLFLLLIRLPAIERSDSLQLALGSLLGAAFLFATFAEIWSNPARLSAQHPTALLSAVHGAVVLARGSFALAKGVATPQHGGIVFVAVAVESIAFIGNSSFFLTSLAKGQIELSHRNDSLLDPLTGLYNRRGFFAEAHCLLTRRQSQPLAIILFDLDHFKRVNDNFGHQTGDRVLKIFASALRSSLRKDDIVARLGGEEFALVTPASLSRASTIAKTIVSEFGWAAANVDGMPLLATVSAGIAGSAPEGFVIDQALERADRALYRAKALGRNRAEIDDGAPAESPRILHERAA